MHQKQNPFITRSNMAVLVEKNEKTVEFLSALSEFGLAEFLTLRSDLAGANLPCAFSENETHYVFTISFRKGETEDDVDLDVIFEDLIADLSTLLTVSKNKNIVFFLVALSKLREGEPEGACRIVAIESSKLGVDEATTEAWGKLSGKLVETGLDRFANDVGVLIVRPPETIRQLMVKQVNQVAAGISQN